MRVSSLLFPGLFRVGLPMICCAALVVGSSHATADESFLSKPSEEWTESEALQVLTDSPWAHTITTTIQDFQCDYEHPAYPRTYPEGVAERLDSIDLMPPAAVVKPD